MTENKCKFCGAEKSGHQPLSEEWTDYACGATDFGTGGWDRSSVCYKREVKTLKALVIEMGKGLDEIAKLGNGDQWGNSIENVMAQKILSCPKVREIMEAK
jgi:hypothetical protein